MAFKEMQFKGKRVFVEVDDAGRILEENGRAKMKYRIDDDKQYSPYVANLSEMNGVPSESVSVKSSSSSKKTTSGKRAASKGPGTDSDVKTAVEKLMKDPSVIIAFTDGACSGNPGPAGLGYTVRFPDGRRIERGEPLGTATNNIAELTAILRVLQCVEDTAARVVIHTDSSYSIGVLTAGWKAKANQSLIAEIKSMLRKFKRAELRKVKGHAGIEDNELVDQLAREAAETQCPV